MIHVLSITSYQVFPAVMGGQKGIALFNRHLSKYVQLTCATIPANARNSSEPYEILPVFSASKLRYVNPFYFFRLKKLIKGKAITHVILEHPYYGWLGFLLKKFLKVRIIVHSHNIESLRFKDFGKWWWKLMWRYEKWEHRMADYSFFISEEDRSYAIQYFKPDADKTTVITYGIQQNSASSQEQKAEAKKIVCNMHNINNGDLLLLYSATLYYGPNLTALDAILEQINPLLQQSNLNYTIVVCGSHLPDHYNKLAAYKDKQIVYAGFVDDIDQYFRAADIFLNPISEGGGIKTKLVEALAGNASAISYKSGAYGVPLSVTGGKLQVVADDDAYAFAESIQSMKSTIRNDIPASFFQHFYWDNIARKAAEKMGELR
ncbi:MAG: glycosyltransferase family 4 protein [Agriterribacter sp.]